MTDKFTFHRPANPEEISGSILGDGRQAPRQPSDASTHPVVTYWLHLAIGSTCMDDRHSQLLTWLSGTVFLVPSRTQPSVPMYSDVHGKRFCSHDTRTLGTLWVGSTSMHSINWCITLYYITINQWHHTRNWLPADNQLQQSKHQFPKKLNFTTSGITHIKVIQSGRQLSRGLVGVHGRGTGGLRCAGNGADGVADLFQHKVTIRPRCCQLWVSNVRLHKSSPPWQRSKVSLSVKPNVQEWLLSAEPSMLLICIHINWTIFVTYISLSRESFQTWLKIFLVNWWNICIVIGWGNCLQSGDKFGRRGSC